MLHRDLAWTGRPNTGAKRFSQLQKNKEQSTHQRTSHPHSCGNNLASRRRRCYVNLRLATRKTQRAPSHPMLAIFQVSSHRQQISLHCTTLYTGKSQLEFYRRQIECLATTWVSTCAVRQQVAGRNSCRDLSHNEQVVYM